MDFKFVEAEVFTRQIANYIYAPVKVKKIRQKLGLTQTQFARMICINISTLQNWEPFTRHSHYKIGDVPSVV